MAPTLDSGGTPLVSDVFLGRGWFCRVECEIHVFCPAQAPRTHFWETKPRMPPFCLRHPSTLPSTTFHCVPSPPPSNVFPPATLRSQHTLPRESLLWVGHSLASVPTGHSFQIRKVELGVSRVHVQSYLHWGGVGQREHEILGRDLG